MIFGMNAIDYTNPPEAFLRTIDIHELLPQQEPFVMVGRLVGFDMRTTVTETTVEVDNLFVEDGLLMESGLVENIAQTCAVRLGYVNKYILKEAIQIGYIGAVRNLDILGLPPVGSIITTTVEVREEVFGVTLADARIEYEGKTIVSTEMKIAVKSDG